MTTSATDTHQSIPMPAPQAPKARRRPTLRPLCQCKTSIPTADGFPLVRHYQGDFWSFESIMWRVEAGKRGVAISNDPSALCPTCKDYLPTMDDGFPLIRVYRGDYFSPESIGWRLEANKRGIDV